MVLRAGIVADEIAAAEHAAVAVDEVALQNQELLHARMPMWQYRRSRLHAHKIAALAGHLVVADRQPTDIRLERTLQIVRKKRVIDAGDAPTGLSRCSCQDC